jgi:predicted solute-binding protein
MLKNHDAALIIGDQAFNVSPHPELEVYDLSEEWGRQTGKSFVHAVVAVRSEVDLENKTLDFIAGASGEGLDKIDAIVDTYTQTHALDAGLCKDYLENKIIYQLGKEELAGLLHFQDLCCMNGLLTKKTPLKFLR